MRTCVIFNPTARGEKARRFRSHLDEIGTQATLKQTAGPDDARRLAAEAVAEGFEVIAAAGGDGTVNEVLNGIGTVPDGFQKVSLAVLPLGTVNVFARELGIPPNLQEAWRVVRQGRETRIDLPQAEYLAPGGSVPPRFFAQLAGAGLDARAIELVKWQLKKKIGPLAYVLAGLNALLGPLPPIQVETDQGTATGGLVLVGNGRLYGGRFRIFPGADLRDGLLEVSVFPRVNWFTLARCGPPLLLRGVLPASSAIALRAEVLHLKSAASVPFEVDGELAGRLPVRITVRRNLLRVIAT